MSTPRQRAADTGAPWTRVCRAEEVPADTPVGVELRGDDETGRVCVVRRDGGFQAMLDRCPHRDIRLSGGVVKDGLLTCPGHFWRFDLDDGHRTDEPAQVITFHPTRVDDEGWVCARLPEPARPMGMREWLLAQARAGDPGQGSGTSTNTGR